MAVAGYNIYLDGVKQNTSLVTDLTYALSGLTASTSYGVTVSAVDDAGNESAQSAVVNFTTSAGASGNVVASISPEYMWHKFDHATAPVVVTTTNITESTDSLTATPKVLQALNSPQRATEGGFECVDIPSTSPYFRILLDEVNNPILKSSFSFGIDLKLKANTLTQTRTLLSVFGDTSNRLFVNIITEGKLLIEFAISGTKYKAETLNAVFDNLAMADFKRLSVTFENNVAIKIYLDDVELPLSATNSGTLGDISNSNLDARYLTVCGGTGSGTYSGVPGFFKQFTLQPVVYSISDIQNLMTL